MHCDCVVFQAVTDDTHANVVELIILLVVSYKRVEGCLAVVPVKSLCGILDYEAVIFSKIKN